LQAASRKYHRDISQSRERCFESSSFLEGLRGASIDGIQAHAERMNPATNGSSDEADIFNIFNHTLFLLFNKDDALSLMAPSTDPNCRGCLNAFTGRYIGTDGRVLKIQDLQNGRVRRDIQNVLFASAAGQGLGDPANTDITRTVQL